MGLDYALVHLKYTIPPAIALTFLYRPLCTRLDVYKILFLNIIAVVATTPWDSYLIRRKIWTYPPTAIIGPTFFSIPLEEVFFFVIQSYSTSLLYLLISTPTFKPAYLAGTETGNGRLLGRLKAQRAFGQVNIVGLIIVGVIQLWRGGKGTYLGLILVWVGPFAFLLWTLAYQFLGNLPRGNILIPIALPTLYLWVVDTLALRRGTWSIESGTKLGLHIWPALEVEEAFFFLSTNVLIVLGLVAFENAVAVLEAFPCLFPDLPALPSPVMLVRALLIDPAKYDNERIQGIREAVSRLKKKSRSFYLASSVFHGRLRIDLILLYSFCRVADDLIDNASSKLSARAWILKLSTFLDIAYLGSNSSKEPTMGTTSDAKYTVVDEFPASTRSALMLLPTSLLSPKPLYELLNGFRTDLEFPGKQSYPEDRLGTFPIINEDDLEIYANRVAGTVAELCLELVFHHCSNPANISPKQREFLVSSGGRMGIALQYVNIARDIATDAALGRVYMPTSWLAEEGLTAQAVIGNPSGEAIEKLRAKLLSKAFSIHEEARHALAKLPQEARAPMRVAVESYMEIGRVLGEKGYIVKAGRATVPRMRRIGVAWKALNEG